MSEQVPLVPVMELFSVHVVAVDTAQKKCVVQARINPQIHPSSQGYAALQMRAASLVYETVFRMEAMGWSLGEMPPTEDPKPAPETSETAPATLVP